MEGISGIVDWHETSSRDGGGAYERARRLMTADANAAAIGAYEGGAAEVVVNDSHGGMRNILVENLDERVRLISGSPKFLSMMEGVPGNDVAMFVGYHSRAHSLGVMNHTYTGSVEEYRINGRLFGEVGMNAAIAGHYGIPVIMITGDQQVAAEAQALIPGVRTVIVKDAVSQLAANLIHPARAKELIQAGAAEAVRAAAKARPQPMVVPGPVRLELRFARSILADAAAIVPGAERVADNMVAWEGPDYLQCYRAFRAMISMTNS